MFLNILYDQVNWNIGKFLVGKFCGTAETAVFALGIIINSTYMTLAWAISGVYIPTVNRIAVRQSNTAELSQLFIQVGRVQFFIIFPILCGFILLGKFFIQIWAGDGYQSAYIVTLLLIAPLTIDLIQNLSIEIQKAKNMHQFRSIIYLIGAGLNFFLTLWLVPYYGAIGAAIGTCIPLLIFNAFVMNWYYHERVGLNIKVFWKNIINILPASIMPALICAGIIYCFPVISLLRFIFIGTVYCVLYVCFIFIGAMNDTEKRFLIGIIKKCI